jgi:hypothetical protein
MGPSAHKSSLTAADRDAALAGDQRADARMEKFNRDVDAVSGHFDNLFAKIARLEAVNADLLAALRRIANARSDGLDHELDVMILERAIAVARTAIAKATA